MGMLSSIGDLLKRGIAGTGIRIGAYGDSIWNAASTGKELRDWESSPGSADSDLLGESEVITQRSRDLARNEPVAEAIFSAHAMPTVGAGLRPIPDPDYVALGWTKKQATEWSRTVKSKLRLYYGSTDPDVNGQNTMYFLQYQVLINLMMNGGVIVLPLYVEDPSRSTKWRTTFQLVEIDQLSNPLGVPDSDVMRGGVELDPVTKKPVALHIQDQHPGDAFLMAGGAPTWTRVPLFTPWGRRRALHIFEQKRVGQHRGVALLAAFMPEFHTLSRYKQAELEATLNNALVAAFIKSGLPMAEIQKLFTTPKDYLEYRAKSGQKLKGGAVIPLPLGDELEAFMPGRPNPNYTAFVETVLRQGLASVGLPLESGMRDFSKTNYSSARAALVEAWRVFSTRRTWLVDWLCNPCNELIMEEMVAEGDIPDPLTGEVMDLDTLYDNWAAIMRAKWLGPGRGVIDPTKEAQATGIRLSNKTTTLEKECAENGDDWEEILDQLETEVARFAERGLKHPALQESKPQPTDKDGPYETVDDSEEPPPPGALPKEEPIHAAA